MTDEKKAPEPVGPGQPLPEYKVKNEMASKPVIAPDGHVILSKEDIDNRA